MALYNALKEQLASLWARWSVAQRIGISAAALACVAAVVGTFIWATRADYVVLANGLTPQRAAEIVSVLEAEKIDVQLNFSGSGVSVPRSDVSKARLALKDVLEPGTTEEAGMAGAFPGSPSEEEDRRRRQLETRLAKSITQIRGIRTATVHISKPDPSPFVDEQTPTTASVIIDPASGVMTASMAESIISLVARAVEGLNPSAISLMDTSGRQFNVADGPGSTMDGQFEYQQRVELRLASKAESMLALLLGQGRAVVRVTADIDFRESTRTELSYDPDGKVKRTETVETVSQTGGTAPSGEAGMASNVLMSNSKSSDGANYKREVISADYDNATINEVVRDIPGKINRLTVAAIVDLSSPAAPADPSLDPAAVPADPATAVAAIDPTQIEAIIKQAVGYDENRGDEIQVLGAKLMPETPEDVVPAMITFWQKYEPLIQTVLTTTIAGLAFLMGFLLLRKLTPVVVTEPSREQQMSLEEVQRLAELSQQTRENPEIAAKILAAWLGEQITENNPATQPQSPVASRTGRTPRAA